MDKTALQVAAEALAPFVDGDVLGVGKVTFIWNARPRAVAAAIASAVAADRATRREGLGRDNGARR